MTVTYTYTLDGEPATMNDLILKGKEHGLTPNQFGSYSPAYVVSFLRQHGHTVVENG